MQVVQGARAVARRANEPNCVVNACCIVERGSAVTLCAHTSGSRSSRPTVHQRAQGSRRGEVPTAACISPARFVLSEGREAPLRRSQLLGAERQVPEPPSEALCRTSGVT